MYNKIYKISILSILFIFMVSVIFSPVIYGNFKKICKDINYGSNIISAECIFDIAFSNYDDNVVVYLNDGNGTFGNRQDYHFSELPGGIKAGDFNNDNNLDMIVLHSEKKYINFLYGNGDGTFSLQEPYYLGFNPNSKCLVYDYNMDGNLDFALVNVNYKNISILLGNGEGSFEFFQDLSVAKWPRDGVVEDFNNDNNIDIAVSNSGSNTVTTYFGNGDGSFSNRRDWDVGVFPGRINAGDYNNDNNIDLVVNNEDQGSLSFLIGDGTGWFERMDVTAASGRMVTKDFNLDGYLDIGIAITWDGEVGIFLGEGNFSFSKHIFTVGAFPISITSEDFNDDNFPDLALIHPTEDVFSIYFGDGTGLFGNRKSYSAGRSPGGLIAECFRYHGNSKTLYVGGSGPDNYSRIQDAIFDSMDGDTVFVYNDSSPYNEFLFVDRSINLIGEDRNTTIINGDYNDTVIDIHADDVTVSGFTVINCLKEDDWKNNVISIHGCDNVIIKDNKISLGVESMLDPWVAGVYIKDSVDNLIENNVIFDISDASRTAGIRISGGSSNNISGNEVYGFTVGISLSSNDNIIYGNDIHHNSGGIDNNGDSNKITNNIVTDIESKGIDNTGVEDTIISGNFITNNGDSGEFSCGIMFSGGSDNSVINNNISNNNPTGIYLSGSDTTYVTDNHISDNENIGIIVYSDNNQISNNHISNNGEAGIYISFVINNIISKNNFIDNGINADFDTTFSKSFSNRWRNNYWDDYSGKGVYTIHGNIIFLIFFSFNWFNIDWLPAKEPYDIGI